jgi:formylglycine-generating enzyme required for sulfatase activity
MRDSVFTALAVQVCALPLGAEPLDVFRDCDVCPEMIELPMGEFVMGAPEDELRDSEEFLAAPATKREFAELHRLSVESEGPQHTVVIDIRFALSKNEITYDEWMACVEDDGCGGHMPDTEVRPAGSPEAIERALTDPRFTHTPSEMNIAAVISSRKNLEIDGLYPVIDVSYRDAQNYVLWLNQKLGTTSYRLPTEAEWEYAARAGTTSRFAQGFEPRHDQANVSGEITEFFLQADRPDLRTLGHPVRVDEMDAANQWGLRHMSGNVAEITLSCYTDRYERWSTSSEWLKNSFREHCVRVMRGGSFVVGLGKARVAYRAHWLEEAERSDSVGFRVLKQMN